MTLEEKVETAVHMHLQGDTRKAEALYREILEEQPGNADVATRLAGLLADTGRAQEAVVLLDDALATYPSHVRAHAQRDRLRFLARRASDPATALGELGAGSGRLAEVFGRSTNFRFLIFDIPPALYVAQWYIKRIFPGERVFEFRPFSSYDEIEAELAGARFAFFTANQIELLPQAAIDIFVNINSLMEMAAEQIANFFVQIDRVTKRWLFLQQWYRWHNPFDKIEVEKDMFRPKGRGNSPTRAQSGASRVVRAMLEEAVVEPGVQGAATLFAARTPLRTAASRVGGYSGSV